MKSTVNAALISNDLNYVTPTMFIEQGMSVCSALQTMCEYAKENNLPVIATGYSGTLDESLVIDGIHFIGGEFKGIQTITVSGDAFIHDVILDGPAISHGGGDIRLSSIQFKNQTTTAAILVMKLPIVSSMDIIDCTFSNGNYGVLQQGSEGEKLEWGRIIQSSFTDMNGDAIELNVVNGHYQNGGMLIENIRLDNINNRNAQTNWGIGIGIAGRGPYSLNQDNSDFASNITIRNVHAKKTRQCIHFEVSRNFIVENVEVYPDSSVSINSALTFAGLAFYGCRDFHVEGVKGEPVGTGLRMVYVAWGTNNGAYTAPCRNFYLSDITTQNGTIEIATSSTNDATNDFSLINVTANLIKHRGLGSKMTFSWIRCQKFDAIGNYKTGEGEGGGIYNRQACIEATINSVQVADASLQQNGSFARLECDRLYTHDCNFDIIQSTSVVGSRGYLLGNIGNTYYLPDDIFPQGFEFSERDVLYKKSGGMFFVTQAGALISGGDTVKTAVAGQDYLVCSGSRNWASRNSKSAKTRIIIPGGGVDGQDLTATIACAPYPVNGAYRIYITPSLSTTINGGTIISPAYPVSYIDVST
jgi:hypothetical protein